MTTSFSEPYSRVIEKIIGCLIPLILSYGVIELGKIRDEMSTLNATLTAAMVRINEHDRRLDVQSAQMLRLESQVFGAHR